MLRGILILGATTLALIALVVGTVAVGLHRLAATQKATDAAWQAREATTPPPPTTFSTVPSTIPAVDAQPDSVWLWASDAMLQGNVKLMDKKSAARNSAHGRDGPPQKQLARSRLAGKQVSAYLTGWKSNEDAARWDFDVPRTGDYEVDITYACPAWAAGGQFHVLVGDKELQFQTEATRNENNFRVLTLGTINLPVGKRTLSVKLSDSKRGVKTGLNLRCVQIVRAS